MLLGQSLGFHLLILFLNFSRESVCPVPSGTKLQIFGSLYLIEFDPFNTVLTCRIRKSGFERKL